MTEHQQEHGRIPKTKEDSDMETSKELNNEELENVAGGVVPFKEKCELCGSTLIGFFVDGKHCIACSNLNCPNSEPKPLFG